MGPLVFTPHLRPAIWGGRRLGQLLSRPLPSDGAWAESWEVSTHSGHVSVVAEGPLSGLSLAALDRSFRRPLLGCEGGAPGFPLLLKYLDARDWLSLQVHPDDRLAGRLAGEARGVKPCRHSCGTPARRASRNCRRPTPAASPA
jgi:mannose-6-phosphate isomerase